MYRDLEARLLANSVVDPATGCWVWLGRRERGYGRINVYVDGRTVKRRAHRVSYEVFIGPIPPGLDLDHECQVASCIHPNHLSPLLPAENNALRWKRAA